MRLMNPWFSGGVCRYVDSAGKSRIPRLAQSIKPAVLAPERMGSGPGSVQKRRDQISGGLGVSGCVSGGADGVV
jgi:hypothetical protein